jgi:hypothetical protein
MTGGEWRFHRRILIRSGGFALDKLQCNTASEVPRNTNQAINWLREWDLFIGEKSCRFLELANA